MDDIRQERSNEGAILKLNKRLKQMSLNKKFSTHVKKSMAFQALKNKKEVKLLAQKTPARGEAMSTSQQLKVS